ncbi:unnamed protein product [Mucor hiemalis]
MALFVPVIIGLPIGYFTWAKVFDSADNATFRALIGNNSKEDILKGPNSSIAATAGAVVSVGVLGKLTFTPQTRHRLFFAKAPPNSNIRVETLKMGIELLIRSGIVFYGGAVGGAVAGRVFSKR